MTEDVKDALREFADGLKKVADDLMSEKDMDPFERQNCGILVGLAARGIEWALIVEATSPKP